MKKIVIVVYWDCLVFFGLEGMVYFRRFFVIFDISSDIVCKYVFILFFFCVKWLYLVVICLLLLYVVIDLIFFKEGLRLNLGSCIDWRLFRF